jgi:REP element-mobilizing transposase RayT
MQNAAQQQLEFPEARTHGGRRKGAGRPKRRDGVAHAQRAKVSRHDPRLVTMKCVSGLPALRTRPAARVVACCIADAHGRRFRIVHYSIQVNHIHLIVEAALEKGLGDGMRALGSRVALALNRLWSRRGSLFAERYHDVVLRSLRQVRNALRYVLNNHLKHRAQSRRAGERVQPDHFSSARYFEGRRESGPDWTAGAPGATVARGGWKLCVGWLERYPLISFAEFPAR